MRRTAARVCQAVSEEVVDTVDRLLSARALLVTGKGGVGKTTVVASLARLLAARGRKVLVAEIGAGGGDPAPAAALLGAPGSEDPFAVGENLDSVVLTPSAGHRALLEETLPARLIADAALRSAAIRRFLLAAPGFSEIGILYRFLGLLAQKDGRRWRYDCCLLDCPATGHALAITQLPAVIARVLPGGSVAKAMRRGLAMLNDPEQTAAVVVSLPQTLAVSEALELGTGLAQNGIPVAGLIANRVPCDPFAPAEREQIDRLCAEHGPMWGCRILAQFDRARSALVRLEREALAPVVTAPDLELRGPDLVAALAASLAEGFSPSAATRKAAS